MTIYAIPDMNCQHCSKSIEAAIATLDPKAELTFDVPARTLALRSKATDADVLTTLNEIGFAANVCG